jgi:hypothetical protein
MKQLRQIIYLDEYKMYSLYSQLFEGLTDYIVQYKEASKREEEHQKGPLASGRLLADIADDRSGKHERRFLHDYAYTQFEEKLIAEKKVVEYIPPLENGLTIPIRPGTILRIKGSAVFNDIKAICDMIAGFNRFGEAITYVTTHGGMAAAKEVAEQKLKEERDRNVRAKMKVALKSLTDVKKQAKEAGLHQDEKFLENLKYLLDYGYAGHFELQIRPSGESPHRPFFSALLKREYLREDATLLVKKHSRQAQGQFCVLGVACQCPMGDEPEKVDNSEVTQLREALGKMVSALSLIEKGFLGRLENEIIIDPLAVYREI